MVGSPGEQASGCGLSASPDSKPCIDRDIWFQSIIVYTPLHLPTPTRHRDDRSWAQIRIYRVLIIYFHTFATLFSGSNFPCL